MEPQDIENLRSNHVFLVDNLDLTHEMFVAHLVQEELLTSDDVERLKVIISWLWIFFHKTKCLSAHTLVFFIIVAQKQTATS